MIREKGREVFGVTSGQRTGDKDIWWWNKEVLERVQRKRLVRTKWDSERTE